jgi:hypothetical protein
MGKAKSPQSLAKLITYILGRRPDEFGLVTDTEGFVKIKELLKAITEEAGWKYVRRSDLNWPGPIRSGSFPSFYLRASETGRIGLFWIKAFSLQGIIRLFCLPAAT